MNTTTKHTPGPWQVHGSHIYTADPERALLAQVLNPGNKASESPLSANARLIAAAPELLQAIKDLFRECAMVHKSWGDGANTKEADAAIKRAKDAIAKATGKD